MFMHMAFVVKRPGFEHPRVVDPFSWLHSGRQVPGRVVLMSLVLERMHRNECQGGLESDLES